MSLDAMERQTGRLQSSILYHDLCNQYEPLLLGLMIHWADTTNYVEKKDCEMMLIILLLDAGKQPEATRDAYAQRHLVQKSIQFLIR